VFPVRYELGFYVVFRRKEMLKGLNPNYLSNNITDDVRTVPTNLVPTTN
jgi:hypothetical protein